MAGKRRGMLIKNTNDRSVEMRLSKRIVTIGPGEERLVTADEVRDPVLRSHLQVRAISIVRPSTAEEDAALEEEIQGARRPDSA